MTRGSGYRQPPGWAATVRRILRAEPECYLRFPCCLGTSSTVDHIVPVSQGGDHGDDNLAAVCQPCHDVKTEAERRFGFARRKPRASAKRQPEPHPNR